MEIENLSWKIERAETSDRDRGDIENQMDIAEKRRMILLKDFFPTNTSSSVAESTWDYRRTTYIDENFLGFFFVKLFIFRNCKMISFKMLKQIRFRLNAQVNLV